MNQTDTYTVLRLLLAVTDQQLDRLPGEWLAAAVEQAAEAARAAITEGDECTSNTTT